MTALREAGHQVLVETQGGRRQFASRTRNTRRPAPSMLDSAAEVWRTADLVVKVKEPQTVRVRLLPPGPDPVHLSAPGAPAGTDRRCWPPKSAAWLTRPFARTRRLAAAADADERSGRPHGRTGGRTVSGSAPTADAAYCWAACPGVAPGQRRDSGRRRRGHQRGQGGGRHGRARHHHRPESEPPARARRHLQRPGGHAGFQCLDHLAKS